MKYFSLAQRSTAPTRLYCQVVLEKGLLSDIRAKCQQIAGRHTSARGTIDYLKRRTSTSSSLTCGPKTALAILIHWQRIVDSSINEWRRRLECVVKNGSGHIKHCNVAISLELTCKLD